MADEYQMTKEAAQIDSIINGAVVFNASTSLSEEEKARARENIGASATGSGLKIVAHYDTLEELEAAVPSPSAGEAYSVGESVPYRLYIWDAAGSAWRDYGAIRAEDITARIVQDIVVPVSAWVEETGVFQDYPYKAEISVSEATDDDFPIVVFNPSDANGGNYASVAYSLDGKIEIFAKTVPTTAVTIPAITFIVAGEGGGSGTDDHTELLNRDAEGQHPISSITGLQQVIAGQQRQITALRNLLEGVAYSTETDTTAAYAKTVPSGAQAVSINSFGGNSVMLNNVIPTFNTTTRFGVTFTNNDDGSYTVSGTATEAGNIYTSSNFTARQGRKYYVTSQSEMLCSMQKSSIRGSTISPTTYSYKGIYTVENEGDASSNNVIVTFRFSNEQSFNDLTVIPALIDLTLMFGAGNEPSTTADPRIAMIDAYLAEHPEYNDGEIVSAEVTEIESKSADAVSLGSITLPSALLSFLAGKGYGQSPVGDSGNTLDLANKKYTQVGSYVNGEWVALSNSVEYDISSYLPTDEAFNFLLTEPGGALTFKQNGDTELSVPQSLVWAIKNSEVTA